MLLRAKKPAIHAGSGVLHAAAYEELMELAELIEAPITTSWGARAVADERHLWPRGWLDYGAQYRYLALDKTYIVSAVTANLVHDLGSCTCGTQSVSACFIMHSLRRAELQVRASAGAISGGCCCVSCGLEA